MTAYKSVTKLNCQQQPHHKHNNNRILVRLGSWIHG